ncbi:DsbA family protein [Palleronia rufa]|uniref:DsbA family protein n=1 Tax=Palleronia rufa TaxID=1530186 RepID=UPI00056B1153|nr:DsbA family protein [Palleronia rufa]
MTRRSAIALAATAVLGGWYMSSAVPGSAWLVAPAFAQQADEADAAPQKDAKVAEMTLGDPDAPVQVIEYASFTCPHCRNFHDNVFDDIKSEYIDTGKIEFVYREVYFDRYGLWAGMVARCGEESKYFGIADLIYERQSEWTKGEPADIAQNLRTIGKTAGLDDAALDACLSDGAMAEALVATYEKNAKADDIDSTPSFVIDGEKFPNMSYDDFARVLDEKLAEDG